MISVENYVTSANKCPFDAWFKSLDLSVKIKIQTLIKRIEAGNMGDVKPVGDGVYERRYDAGPGYCLYFGKDGDKRIILLMGGTKRKQDSNIHKAKTYWSDYLARKENR